MKFQLIFYCALVFYLELAASVTHDVDTPKYSGVHNARLPYKTYYQPNLTRPYQHLNQNSYNTVGYKNQDLPKINTVNKFSNNRQEYVPKDPQQVPQEQLLNNRYLNHHIPINSPNLPIHRQWRNVNGPEFQKLPIQRNPESYLSVTEKEYLNYKNNHKFEAYNFPQAGDVVPVPRFGNPSNFNNNPHHVSLTEENRHLNTKHQDNEHLNTAYQSFTPQIPSVPPKRDLKAKPKNILINQTEIPKEIKAENKAPLPVPPNFVNRLLARAENPVEQIGKAVKTPSYNVHNIISDARINQILYSTKHRKRYLVIHPNGTVEHVDTLKIISQRHPHYVLVHAGDIISNPFSKVKPVADSSQLSKHPQMAIMNYRNVQNTSVVTKPNLKEQNIEIPVELGHKEINKGRPNSHLNAVKVPISNSPLVQINNNKIVPSNAVIKTKVVARPTIKVIHNNKTAPVLTVKQEQQHKISTKATYEIVTKTSNILSHVREKLVSLASAIQTLKQTVTKPITNAQKAPIVSNPAFKDKKVTPKQVNTTAKSETPLNKNETSYVPHKTPSVKNIAHTKAVVEIVPEKKQIVNSTKLISSSKVVSAPSGKEKEPANTKNNTVTTQPNIKFTIVYGANSAPENDQLINSTKAISASTVQSVSAPVVVAPAKDKELAITKANAVSGQTNTKPTIKNGANVPLEYNQIVNNAKATSASTPIVLTSGTEKEPATKKADTVYVQPHTTFTIIYGPNVPTDKQPTKNISTLSFAQNATSKISTNNVTVEATAQTQLKSKAPSVKSIAKVQSKPDASKRPLLNESNVKSNKAPNNTNTQDKKSLKNKTEVSQNPKVLNTTAEVNSTLPKQAQIPTANNVVKAFTSTAEKPIVGTVTPTQTPLKDNKIPGKQNNPETPSSTKTISTPDSGPAKPQQYKFSQIPGELDLSKVKSQEKPAVWFRTTDPNFWDKLTDGNETYDVVYFFQIHNQPKVENDTKKTIYPNGTIVEEITKSVWEEGQETPKITKTTLIKHPDDVQ